MKIILHSIIMKYSKIFLLFYACHLLFFTTQFINAKDNNAKTNRKSQHQTAKTSPMTEEEQSRYMQEQYDIWKANRDKEKSHNSHREKLKESSRPPEGMTPSKLGFKRNKLTTAVELTPQVLIPSGVFWFGTQIEIGGKVVSSKSYDGAKPRRKVMIKNDFMLDKDCVTNEQFQDFVTNTKYVTEAELYGWSFVLEFEASADVIAQADGPTGYGRVKDARHWLAVPGANWSHPYGPDSHIKDLNRLSNYPVVQVSYKDAKEYCLWAGRRLPTEREWEYAARGGLINKTYSWGDFYQPKHKDETLMNVWEGNFPKENSQLDGFLSIAPVFTYQPNSYGVFNLLGNVWERVDGWGNKENRILRGGSYIDSIDGSFNHPVIVSTRLENPGDSTATNSGFRCAATVPKSKSDSKTNNKKDETIDTNNDVKHHTSINEERIEL